MTPTFIEVEGRRTRVRVDGDPSDPPILLLHGIGRSLEDWSPQFARMSRRHRLISLDLPGSGFSQRLEGRTSLPGLADAALATLDALGVHGSAYVVGNSLGGAVAQQMAVIAPHRVAGLVLANSAGFGREVTFPLRLLATPVIGPVLATHTTPASAKLSEAIGFADPALVTSARIEHALAIAREPDTGHVLAETARALASLRGVRPGWRKSLLRVLSREAPPVLVIWGDKDQVLPPHHVDEALRRLPHARSHLFQGVGHMPQIEAAAEFATIATEFVDDIEARTAHNSSATRPASHDDIGRTTTVVAPRERNA